MTAEISNNTITAVNDPELAAIAPVLVVFVKKLGADPTYTDAKSVNLKITRIVLNNMGTLSGIEYFQEEE